MFSSAQSQDQLNRHKQTVQKCVNCSTEILPTLPILSVSSNPTQVEKQQGPPLSIVTLESPVPPDIFHFHKSDEIISSKITYAQALSSIFMLPPLEELEPLDFDLGPGIYSTCYLCTQCASKLDTIFQIYAELCDLHHQVNDVLILPDPSTKFEIGIVAGSSNDKGITSSTASSGTIWFSTLKTRADLLLDSSKLDVDDNEILEDIKLEQELLDLDCFDNDDYDESTPISDPSYDNSDSEIEKKNPNLQALTEILTRPCVVRIQRVDLSHEDGQDSPEEPRISSTITNNGKQLVRARPWSRIQGRSKSRSSKGKPKPENPRRLRDPDPLWDDEIEPSDLDPSSSDSDSDFKIKSKNRKLSAIPKPPRVRIRVRQRVNKPPKPPKPQPPSKYSCPRSECTFKCATRTKLLAHLTSATDGPDGQGHSEPPTLRICEWCKPLTIWPNGREYLTHIQSHANGPDIPTCTECENPHVFPNIDRLHRHQLYTHNGEWEGFPCSTCGKRLTTRRHRKHHEMSKHSEGPVEKNCVCETCGSRFLRMDQLTDHKKRVHLPDHLKIPCPHPGCTYKAQNSERLKLHSIKHETAKNFQCHLCPNSYKFQRSLFEHLICHENQRKWICTSFGNVSCGNPRFNRKLHLVQHIVAVHHIGRKEAGEIASRPESKTEEPYEGKGNRNGAVRVNRQRQD